jgi:hypothetical protein
MSGIPTETRRFRDGPQIILEAGAGVIFLNFASLNIEAVQNKI